MDKVDLNAIYKLMLRQYGVICYTVETYIELNHLKLPKQIKFTFDYDKNIPIDNIQLHKRLKRFISNASDFYVQVENSKIILTVECYRRKSQIDYDFEFSIN